MNGRLKELFLRAVQRSPTERAAYLDEACAEDMNLRREVEALLRHHTESRESEAAPNIVDLPESIGGYSILAIAGEGGMGVVYRAVGPDDGWDGRSQGAAAWSARA